LITALALTAGFANLEIFSLVMRLMGLESLEPPHNGTVGFWDGYLKDDR